LQVDGDKLSLKRIETVESEDDEEEEVPANKEKRKSFEFKRKAHYNEFMAVKLARQLMQNDDEEDGGTGKEPQSSEVEEVDIDQDVEGSDDDIGIEGVGNKENAENTEMDTKELSNEAIGAATDVDIATL